MRRRFGEIWPQNLYGSAELVLHRRWHQKQPGRPIPRPSLGAKQIATKQSRFCNLSLRPLFRTLLLVLFLSWQRGGLNRRIQGRPAGRCSGGLSGLPRLRGKVAGVLTPTHPSPNRCIETLHCCRGPGFMPTGRVCGATAGCEATPAGRAYGPQTGPPTPNTAPPARSADRAASHRNPRPSSPPAPAAAAGCPSVAMERSGRT